MKRPSQSSSARTQRRGGFTLLELLVVIAIIALLAALGAAASIRVMSEQVQKATEQSVQKLQTALNHQWVAAVDTARKEAIPAGVEKTLMGWANNDPHLMRVIYVKLRLVQEFPQSFREAKSGTGPLPPKQSYLKYLGPGNKTSPPYRDPTINGIDGQSEEQHGSSSILWHECSACLYMALKESRHGMDANLDNILSGREVTDQFVGYKEILDFWGNPVVFCRFPTGNRTLNPNGPERAAKVGWQDSLDGEGLLSGAGGQFATVCHTPPPKGSSYKLMPVVFSAGRNMHYGVEQEPWKGIAPKGGRTGQDEYDNVYSIDVRMLGHGN